MAAASCLLTEDHFLCSICLNVFTDPVSTPCGHNFCKTCITQYWSTNVKCLCPNCNSVCSKRLKLQVNTFISELSAQFRLEAQQKTSSSSEQQLAKPGEVPCDICTETKVKALKSCLVCLSSYCETHLKPHHKKSSLKKHQLIDPVEDLGERTCKKHEKLLELFCKTDQTFVCAICLCSDHKTCDYVPLKEESDRKKAELEKTEAEIQQMIQERKLKKDEMKRSVEQSKMNADRNKTEGVEFFTALKESVERGQAEFIKNIEEKQRTMEKKAEDYITQLDQEISDLTNRSCEVEKLLQSEDHLHLLQKFSSLNSAPSTEDWTTVSIHQPSYDGTVVRPVIQLEKRLSEQMKNLFKTELRRVQQHLVNVTLDPDNSRLTHGCRCITSNQSFNSGKFYFEVQVGSWSTWTLGVTSKSKITREILLSPSNGYWTIFANQEGGFSEAASSSVCLSVKSHLEKVGVFVDYEQGLVSFYDVDTTDLIFSFTDCCFTGKLHPFFSICCIEGVSGSWWGFILGEHKLCLKQE